jgi:F-type H+-transporting ATPase subunit epsilon
MADTMQFDLVSPERRLASLQATEVILPGMEGDLTAMPGHEPVITTLRPGILTVKGPDGETTYVVSGGFAEVTGEACTVLAGRSHPVNEMDQGIFNEMLAEARARHDEAKTANEPGPTDDIVKMLADMVAMGTHIGLNAD